MKKILTLISVWAFAITASAQAPELKPEVFDLINLDYPGLENVKALHAEGKDAEAASALLTYYKHRIWYRSDGCRCPSTRRRCGNGDSDTESAPVPRHGYFR